MATKTSERTTFDVFQTFPTNTSKSTDKHTTTTAKFPRWAITVETDLKWDFAEYDSVGKFCEVISRGVTV